MKLFVDHSYIFLFNKRISYKCEYNWLKVIKPTKFCHAQQVVMRVMQDCVVINNTTLCI